MICLLTFQLVKDMAVYEMGVALTPASQMLAQATEQEVKIDQLNGELAAIERQCIGRRVLAFSSLWLWTWFTSGLAIR